MRIQKCEGCGIEFKAMRSTRKWCDECKRLQKRLSTQRSEQRERQRRGQRQPGSKAVCAWCGKQFLAMRSDAKTCSPECAHLANLEKTHRFEQTHRGTCIDCGTSIARRSDRCLACSQKGRIESISGPKNYAWKGGRSKDHYGYILVLANPEQRKGHRYRFEHTMVWEAANGPLPDQWVIHHINGQKDDNRLENLEAMPRKKHNHRHSEHDRRILELEAEVRQLRKQLSGTLHS